MRKKNWVEFNNEPFRNEDNQIKSGTNKCSKIKIFARRSLGNRRMKEPVAIKINPAKELPIALEVWVNGIEDGFFAIDR